MKGTDSGAMHALECLASERIDQRLPRCALTLMLRASRSHTTARWFCKAGGNRSIRVGEDNILKLSSLLRVSTSRTHGCVSVTPGGRRIIVGQNVGRQKLARPSSGLNYWMRLYSLSVHAHHRAGPILLREQHEVMPCAGTHSKRWG